MPKLKRGIVKANQIKNTKRRLEIKMNKTKKA